MSVYRSKYTLVMLIVLVLALISPSVADDNGLLHGNVTEAMEEILEEFDLDHNHALSITEATTLFNEGLNDQEIRDNCHDTLADMFEEADANSNGLLEVEDDSTELSDFVLGIFHCGLEATTAATATLIFNGETYICEDELYEESLGEEHNHLRKLSEDEHAHDEHGHEEEGGVDLEIGEKEFHCTLQEEVHNDDNDLVVITIDTWMEAMLAVAVVCNIALIGIFLLLPCFKNIDKNGIVMKYYVPAATSGALLSAVMVHILPEVVAMIGSFDINLSLFVTGGFLIGMVLELFLDGGHMHGHSHTGVGVADSHGHSHGHSDDDSHSRDHSDHVHIDNGSGEREKKEADSGHLSELDMLQKDFRKLQAKYQLVAVGGDIEMSDMKTDPDSTSIAKAAPVADGDDLLEVDSQMALRSLIVVGDAIHNVVDGVVIGIAFAVCGSETGWLVTLSVILHELPQELADFLILISTGLSPFKALLFNFISAIAAVIGCIISLLIAGHITESTLGYFLGLGVGILLYISAADLVPIYVHYNGDKMTLNSKVLAFFLFILMFAIVAVITTYFDKHCGDHGGEGHDDH